MLVDNWNQMVKVKPSLIRFLIFDKSSKDTSIKLLLFFLPKDNNHHRIVATPPFSDFVADWSTTYGTVVAQRDIDE